MLSYIFFDKGIFKRKSKEERANKPRSNFWYHKNRAAYKIEKGGNATLFAYNHKTMNGNQPSTERFQPKPSVSKTTNTPKGLEREKNLLNISH